LLSSTLVRMRARFAGDLDQYLIYLVFLLDDLAREIAVREGPRRTRLAAPRGLNALSIAEVTDIPRETARRKLHLMVAAGYIERGYDGLYYLGDRFGLDQFFYELRPLFLNGMGAEASRSFEPVEPNPKIPHR